MSANTLSAREAILAQVRGSLGDVPRAETPDEVTVLRNYRVSDPTPRAELLELFIERVADYNATVHRVVAADLAPKIAECLAARKIARLVVPADVPDDWLPIGLTISRDPGLTVDQLEASDGVLTGCALGIALTGTIVLDGGPYQGRRVLTLLPDYHLCVVREGQVVGLVPEAFDKLRDAASKPGRPITLISGPSATSDIELNRVEGVHGPRTLEVLVVS